MSAAQQQLPAQSLPAAQARADAVAAQAIPALAGTTMLASPQVNPLPGQVAAPAPPGTDTAAAQARDAVQLAPAGHTIAGFLRRRQALRRELLLGGAHSVGHDDGLARIDRAPGGVALGRADRAG
jgi:hypothetical protein